jgi:hypothetical protein
MPAILAAAGLVMLAMSLAALRGFHSAEVTKLHEES